MDFQRASFIRFAVAVFLCSGTVWSTFRYYSTYTTYGSGDTMISTFHVHMGPRDGAHKWNVECLDGEALVGIGDSVNDFARVDQVWCKFMFPQKPPSQMYPYYAGCHVRDFGSQFFCFDPNNATKTLGTFITAIWAMNFFFHISDLLPFNNEALMKCCHVPNGYYIDYMSCYYVSTHDEFFEYYDNSQIFITYCATGYVATGIAKKIGAYQRNTLHPYAVDWLQCCRLGFGPHQSYPPPVTYAPSGAASYYSARALTPDQVAVPAAYRNQYKNKDASSQLAPKAYDADDGDYDGYSYQEEENAVNSSLPMNRPFMGLRDIPTRTAEDVFNMDRELRIRPSQLERPS